jgi:hypothetical protein
MSDPIATLSPSPFRRAIAVGFIGLLAVLALAVALLTPPVGLGFRLYLIAVGAVAAWLAHRIWRATARSIALRPSGLYDSEGRCLCALDNVVRVERGAFAFKPSNGFVVHLKRPTSAGWAPGLWWRIGRRLGVGGVTPAGQGRAMADLLSLQVREADAGDEKH